MRRRCGFYKRRSRRLIIVFILVLMVAFIFVLEKAISPMIGSIADAKVHSLVTESVNKIVKQQFEENPEYQDYQTLMTIERGSDGNVELMLPNTSLINQLVADITFAISDQLSTVNQTFYIPAGSITKSKLFASLGPKIPIKTTCLGYVNIGITDDFISAGVNQTRHRIWLNISSEMMVSVPFIDDKITVETTVLLTEGIIIGPVPDTYVNIG